MICGFRSVLCVSLFQGSLLVIVIMIDGSDKHNCDRRWLLNFRVRMFVKRGTEGLGEGCVEIMQIVSCLELMANLFIFIHNVGI